MYGCTNLCIYHTYVCMCVYIYVYTYAYTHTQTHTHMYNKYICAHTHTHTHMYNKYICVYVHLYICMYIQYAYWFVFGINQHAVLKPCSVRLWGQWPPSPDSVYAGLDLVCDLLFIADLPVCLLTAKWVITNQGREVCFFPVFPFSFPPPAFWRRSASPPVNNVMCVHFLVFLFSYFCQVALHESKTRGVFLRTHAL